MDNGSKRKSRLRRFLHNIRESDDAILTHDFVKQNGSDSVPRECQNVSLSSPNDREALNGKPSLWDEIYDSVTTSTAPSHLKDVAKLLRDQSKCPPILAMSQEAGISNETSRELHLCMDVLRVVQAEKTRSENKAGLPFGRQIGIAYNEIITWTQKFVALGDVISQVDPVHIGLPWARVRLS